jgi:DNA-binding LytR/AlgR family response regulator
MKITCMIIDDEPLAQKVLEKYITALPSLKLVKKCNNAPEAIAWLHENIVDLIFLDIKMPIVSGIDFLKSLIHKPQVILTTAYSEYALEGYEYAVVDYLLKPISFERFLKAVNKVAVSKSGSEIVEHKSDIKDFIFLKEDKINHRVFFDEIRYMEACGNFIKVYTEARMILVAATMTNMEKTLPKNYFVRVHKSFIVSIQRIDQIEGNMISIGKNTIPIGNSYKMIVEQVLSKYKTA